MKLNLGWEISLLVVILALSWPGPAGCSKKQLTEPTAAPGEPDAVNEAAPPAPEQTAATEASPGAVRPTESPAPVPKPAQKPVSLSEALAKAVEQTSGIPFEPTGMAKSDRGVAERERVWRDDQLHERLCVSGYPRAKPTVRAVAELLDDDHLHEWLEHSLQIAQDPEMHRQLLGDDEDARLRRSNYNPQFVVSAIYNLARDPEQKARALAVWEDMETRRVEEESELTKQGLARLKSLESPTLQDKLRLKVLEERVIKRKQITKW